MACLQSSAELPAQSTHCPVCGDPVAQASEHRPAGSIASLEEGSLAAEAPPRSWPALSSEPRETPTGEAAAVSSGASLSSAQLQFIRKLHLRKVRVTHLIIAINLLLFILLEWNGGSRNPQVLIEFGARFTPLIRDGQYWRLLTNTFLHAGYLHVLFNMYGLYNLGSVLERLYGPTRFLFLYLCSGIAGSVVSWLATQSLSVGASGAVFGVAGVMVVYGFKHKKTIPHEMASSFGKGALPFIALNLYLGFSHPQIDNYAHIGGLLAGMLLSALMNPGDDPLLPSRSPSRIAVGKNLAMQLASIAVLAYGVTFGARNYWPQRQLHEAEAFFKEGTQRLQEGKFDQAVSALSRAISINPRDPRFRLSLGAAYFSLDKPEKAIEEYQQSLREKADAPETYVNLAIAWKRLGKEDKAMDAYNQAIRLKPGMLPAYLELGLLYLNAGRDSSAAELFVNLLKARPGAESYLVAGQAYFNAGRVDSALEQFRKAVQAKPDLAQAHLWLASALLKKNLRAEAAESYRKVLQLDSHSTAARAMLTRILAQNSIAHLKNGRWDAAEAEIHELLKADASSAEAHLLLGTVLANKRQFEQAAREFETFLKMAPDAPNAGKVRLEIERLRKIQG
ncbi:MAG: rhomboid family intramembrane serine protease [Acidimicrobiia bacterium]|nr:rhomboid family intramembrane serine protease [Acidimicrobiia bacterium]